MSASNRIAEYQDFLADELNSAMLYDALAEQESNSKLAEVYRRLAATERRHAGAWVKKLEEEGVSVPPFEPWLRTRLLIWLAQRFGAESVLPGLVAGERNASRGYTAQLAAQAVDEKMVADEKSHAFLLRQVGRAVHGGLEGPALARLEGRHRSAGGNALRAAVLGANDGLVSNFSLVMGVAGAELGASSILLTGMAGLLAGAISMALGEWISVQSSRELYQRQIAIEEQEIEQAPEEEAEELALIYQARGMDEELARQLAEQIMTNRSTALDTLTRDELGIDPEELGGSAMEAALTSFLLFALGAIIPVIPYFFMTGFAAVIISAVFSALGLFGIGAAITLFTGRPVWWSGLRQVGFGLAAALVTYTIGRLLGVNLAG